MFWASGAMIIVFLTILVLKLLLDKRGVIYDLSIKSECMWSVYKVCVECMKCVVCRVCRVCIKCVWSV